MSRNRIRDIAIRLIFERGYHATSMRAIAGHLGMKTASLYYHFPSKQNLLIDIMSETMQDLIAKVTEATRGESDPEGRLRAAIRAHVLFHTDRRMEAFIADAELRSLEGVNRERVVQLRDRYEELFRAILRDGQTLGIFDVADVKLATYALMAMCTGVATWFQPGGRLTLEEISERYAQLFLYGIRSGARVLESTDVV